MKKILIVIALFLILIGSRNVENEFSLLDYFSGEYTAYTEKAIGEACVDLGFCYMQNSSVNESELIGESLKIENFEPSSALDVLNAKVVKTEYLDNGTVIIYAYSNHITNSVEVENQKVNLQIAHNDEYSVIGWPLILGSF